MATYVALEGHQTKGCASTKGHKRNLSTSIKDTDNINVIEINSKLCNGKTHGKNKLRASIPPGVSQIQICPAAVTAGKNNKSKKAETNSSVHLTNRGREVNVISVQRPVASGSAAGAMSPNVESNKTTDVTRGGKSGVSLVKIRDPNSPASKPVETTEEKEWERLNTRGPGEYYSQYSIEAEGRAVSQVDVSKKSPEKLRKKRVPVIDIKDMVAKRVGKPTTIELPPEPPKQIQRTAITDIPPTLPRQAFSPPNPPPPTVPPEAYLIIPNTTVMQERNLHFQAEPRMDERYWFQNPVVNNQGRSSEGDFNPYYSTIGSDVTYGALKESRGVQTKPMQDNGRVIQNRVEIVNETSRVEDMYAELRERSTQTNPDAETQTIQVLEPAIQIISPPSVHSRSSDDDDVTEIYTQIREVDRERKKDQKKQKELEERIRAMEKKAKKEERKIPERSNSTKSNRSVPAVLKPRSELRKQIVPESIENGDVSDSDSSENSNTTLDTVSTMQTVRGSERADENQPPAREKRKMRRLSRLDQVKKPVVSKTEIHDVDPVPARAPLRDRPQLLGVFSIKTYSSHPKSKCRPTGLAISPGGNYIVTDHSDKTVKIFNKSGQVKVEFGEKHLVKPWGVTLLEDGNMAVSDPGDTSVKIFTRKGRFVKKFEFANLVEPYGLTRSNAGDILVADKGANGLYVFDGNGFLKGSLGNSSNGAVAEWPQYVTVDSQDNIIISDYMSHTVRIFSPSGTLLKEHGGMGTGTGQLMCPQGICVDKYGHILVADNINSRVKILSPEGEFIRDLITSKSGLEGPEAVALDPEGNLVVTEGISGEVKLFSYVL